MFERYTLSTSAEVLGKALNVEVPDRYAPRFNAAPTGLLPVITNEHPEGVSFFYWGLPPSMAKSKSVSKKLTNAEITELTSKASYKNSLSSRRCIIPANGLYYWKKVSKKGKVPYRFILNDENIFVMAGLWDEFDLDGTIVHTFNIITKPANVIIQPLSPTMPLIVESEQINRWLSANDLDTALNLLQSDTEINFGSYPVSSKINNIEIDQADLINQSSPMDQFGNYSLFD